MEGDQWCLQAMNNTQLPGRLKALCLQVGLSSTVFYRLTSFTEEYKCPKARLQKTLDGSQCSSDNNNNNAPSLVAEHQWRSASAAEETVTAFKHADIVEHTPNKRSPQIDKLAASWNRARAPVESTTIIWKGA